MRHSLEKLILGFIASLLFWSCSETQVAGTSSGVDNPALTVTFRDASGSALRVTGDLDVYSQDQNPAVDPEPLVTLKIKNSSFTNLTANDFNRVGTAAAKQSSETLFKIAADEAVSDSQSVFGGSGVVNFNLILKTQDGTGSLILGFSYDSVAKAFSRPGNTALTRIDVEPKPLVRYQAKVARESIHGEAGRIFIPGTPFLANLADSTFIIENMTEGTFPLRLLATDGKVFPIQDSLNSRDSTRIYRPLIVPEKDVVYGPAESDTLFEFQVLGGADKEAFIELPAILEAKVLGIQPGDPRLTFLWREIRQVEDTAVRQKAVILDPTRHRCEIRFANEGVYEFEIKATFGVRVRTDTVAVSVRRLPPPVRPRIIQPKPGDILKSGQVHNIQWEMPKAPVTVQLSVTNGKKWLTLAQIKEGQSFFPWTPTPDSSEVCLVRVVNTLDTTVVAKMEGTFILIP